jgi:Cdc6-like AAA superfamily ATPase
MQSTTPMRSRKTKRKLSEITPDEKENLIQETQKEPEVQKKNVTFPISTGNTIIRKRKPKNPKTEIKTPETFPKMKLQEKIRRLAKARDALSRSLSPEQIFGREKETQEIFECISNSISSRKGTSLLVTGRPGTGKTLVVNDLLPRLLDNHCKHIYINCMDLTKPKNLFKRLVNELTSENLENTEEAFTDFLEELFINNRSKTMYILILDEIERLLEKKTKGSVLDFLFSWTSEESSKLVLVGIANMSDLASKIDGMKIFNRDVLHVTFQPYTSQQFELILKERLNSAGIEHLFDPKAIKFISKKLESEGDARKLLDVSKKSIDLLLAGKTEIISMGMVHEIFKTYISSSTILQIQSLPAQNQVVLCACVRLLENDQVNEITIQMVFFSFFFKFLFS